MFGCNVFASNLQDVFIVDNGEAGIWVWCGRRATKQEKREGMANASVSWRVVNVLEKKHYLLASMMLFYLVGLLNMKSKWLL